MAFRILQVGPHFGDNVWPIYNAESAAIHRERTGRGSDQGRAQACMTKQFQQVWPTEGTVGFD